MRIKDMTLSLLNIFIAAVEVILGLRFVLKLFGANADNGVVSWVYEMSSVLLEPFRGIFPVRVFENQYVLEFSTLFAMIIYGLLGLFLLWLIAAIAPDDAPASTTKKRR